MWGVGCILYEMLVHKPMFPGSTTDEQLNLIFQRLGTPNPENYPNLCQLPLFKTTSFKPHSVKSLVHPPRINAEKADLLMQMLKVRKFIKTKNAGIIMTARL
jgi:serine/threonine protein kinase